MVKDMVKVKNFSLMVQLMKETITAASSMERVRCNGWMERFIQVNS
jgi:hypothetical protein